MNAFIIWSQQQRRNDKENTKLNFAEQNRRIGVMWKAMTEQQKRPYFNEEERLRLQYKLDHPNYRYNPRKKSSVRCARCRRTKSSRLPRSKRRAIWWSGRSKASFKMRTCWTGCRVPLRPFLSAKKWKPF